MKLIVILLCMSFFVGCTDLLRVEPENSLTFGNITKEKDVEALVYGVGAGYGIWYVGMLCCKWKKELMLMRWMNPGGVPGCWNWKPGRLICGKLGIR